MRLKSAASSNANFAHSSKKVVDAAHGVLPRATAIVWTIIVGEAGGRIIVETIIMWTIIVGMMIVMTIIATIVITSIVGLLDDASRLAFERMNRVGERRSIRAGD